MTLLAAHLPVRRNYAQMRCSKLDNNHERRKEFSHSLDAGADRRCTRPHHGHERLKDFQRQGLATTNWIILGDCSAPVSDLEPATSPESGSAKRHTSSARGKKQRIRNVRIRSALPSNSDVRTSLRYRRFGPDSEVMGRITSLPVYTGKPTRASFPAQLPMCLTRGHAVD